MEAGEQRDRQTGHSLSSRPTGFLRAPQLRYHKELQMQKAEFLLAASLLGAVAWLLLLGVWNPGSSAERHRRRAWLSFSGGVLSSRLPLGFSCQELITVQRRQSTAGHCGNMPAIINLSGGEAGFWLEVSGLGAGLSHPGA